MKEEFNQEDLFTYSFENDDNIEENYEILATFKSKKYNKIYYIMTDNKYENNEKLKTYAFCIDDINAEGAFDSTFYPVTDEEELKLVNQVFNSIQKEIA